MAISDDEEDETRTPKKKTPAERAELKAAIPAIFVDTWSTLRWKGYMRITLGEYLYRNPHYRAAFLMELDEAENFANHLLRAIQKQRDEDNQLNTEPEDTVEGATNSEPEMLDQEE